MVELLEALGCRSCGPREHELAIERARSRGPPSRRPRASLRGDARLHRRYSGHCSRAAARRTWRCRAATTSGSGRSTSTPTVCPRWARRFATTERRSTPRRLAATARDAHHARVPEPHRDRQPADGLRARRGSIGDRQRGARARGRGPRPPAHRDGRARSTGSARRRLTIEGVPNWGPRATSRHRPGGDGHLPRRRAHHRGRGAGARRAPRPHGDVAAKARGDGCHGRSGRPGIRCVGPGARPRLSTWRRCPTRAWRRTTSP